MSGLAWRVAVALVCAGVPALASAGPVGDKAIAAAVADPGRDAKLRALDESRMPAAILAFAQVARGETVAEWGSGSGYYTTMLSDLVGPKGTVYAVDIAANQDMKAWAPILAKHPNVRAMFVPGEAEVFAPGSFDAIFAHLEYHDLYWTSAKEHFPTRDPAVILRNWFSALRPGGRVIIVDHVGLPGDPRENADKYHRIDPERVKADFAAAGFVLDGSSDVLRRSSDPHTVGVFDPAVRGKTDRFVFRFVKPK